MIDESCVPVDADEDGGAEETGAEETGRKDDTEKTRTNEAGDTGTKAEAEETSTDSRTDETDDDSRTDDPGPTADPEADWRRTWHALGDLLGSKWAFHVVRALADSERGFNDLKRELDGVTAKTLSERLQELRCLGFVEKELHATSPPTTTYRLTDHGEELAGVLADVESLVEVVECRDGDCAVPPRTTPKCASDCACES